MADTNPRSVWKYPLGIDTVIDMPGEARPLHVGHDPSGQPSLWAEVEPGQPERPHRFRTYGTGHIIDGPATYIGTFQGGPGLVWHVYEAPA